MISWQESVRYDPLGDCSRADRNKEFWKRQRGAARKQLPNQGEQPVTNRMNKNSLPPGYKVVKRDPKTGCWCSLLRRSV